MWEERLVLFAWYLFNFFHDSRLRVLAELRESCPLCQSKQRQWVCIWVELWYCVPVTDVRAMQHSFHIQGLFSILSPHAFSVIIIIGTVTQWLTSLARNELHLLWKIFWGYFPWLVIQYKLKVTVPLPQQWQFFTNSTNDMPPFGITVFMLWKSKIRHCFTLLATRY